MAVRGGKVYRFIRVSKGSTKKARQTKLVRAGALKERGTRRHPF